jgi:hypothetical protein
MFNLWPKNEVKEIIDNIPKFAWKVNPTIYIDEKEYTVRELVDYVKNLLQDNKDLKKILENIEEDGTYEHNNAIKLREENAELRSKFDEFVKEILGLRHLKEENVQLMERINKLIEDGTRVCVENASLKESNVQLMERVNEIDSDMNKGYQAEIFILKNEIAMLKAKYQILEHNYQGCTKYRDEYKHQLNAANEEIKKLKEDIIDYVIEKDDEIKELEKTQKHPMYPIHWGGLDPDILKQAKEQSIEEIVELFKGIKTQGFEDYDPRDFVESEIKNEDPLEGKQVKYTWCYKCQYITEQCKCNEKVEKWSTTKVAIQDAVQAKQREVYGVEATLTDLPKTFPNEFQEETTAENLEEKFDKGKDVLDYFEKPWRCTCNMCKHAREESQDKSWEEAASDLALKVTKLEKQIEELKINRNLTNQ